MEAGTEVGTGTTKPRGRKGADRQEAVTKPQVVEEKIEQLVVLHRAAATAAEEESEAIKACAEASGYNAGAIKKLVVARAGDKFLEKKRDVAQQYELFEEVGEA